ncbi:MAG: hypothetical protein JWQ90_2980 [Hydrocarboniphaga sp.]|uniref:hypothetical protein n=1 Tax=Hydrocarboniphaga sp. TaxID=2033016 RepID=UPI00260DBABC|nr:hypothetical protein [Hydrocarboniphaga sp.]MDB5970530.1 hypothetical protein [Hydrocarboniphaga sp.]
MKTRMLRKLLILCAPLYAAAALPVAPTSWAQDGNLGPAFRVDAVGSSGIGSLVDSARDAAGNSVIVWQRIDANAPGIYARAYDASGVALSPEIKLALTDGWPSVAMLPGGRYVVSCSSYDDAMRRYHIQAQQYALDGTAVSGVIEVASYARTGNLVAYAAAPVASDAAGNFVVVWNHASATQIGSSMATVFGGFSTNNLDARRYGSDGVAKGAAFRAGSDLPDLSPLGLYGNSVPVLAMNASGAFVVAWSSNGLYRNTIEYQRFDAAGRALGLKRQANPNADAQPYAPAVAIDDAGDFVIGWALAEGAPGAAAHVGVQRFAADGKPQASPLNAYASSGDYGIRGVTLGMQPGGEIIVGWSKNSLAGDAAVEAQRYDVAGVAADNRIAVAALSEGYLMTPAVAIDGNGDFVLAWAQNPMRSGDFGVYARLYRGP